MKILFLNVGYCMGFDGRKRNYLIRCWRNLHSGKKHLTKLELLVRRTNPDVLALAEVDSGSLRGSFVNQLEKIEKNLHFRSSYCKLKYKKRRVISDLPIFRKQCNAILAKKEDVQFHSFYMKRGVKKLLIQAKLEKGIDFFLVHLPLGPRVRQKQLQQVERIIKRSKKVIVAGDFNTFGGPSELEELMKKCDLRSANSSGQPTFPSGRPKTELDFFLVSRSVKIKKFKILPSDVSDHLPILLEI